MQKLRAVLRKLNLDELRYNWKLIRLHLGYLRKHYFSRAKSGSDTKTFNPDFERLQKDYEAQQNLVRQANAGSSVTVLLATIRPHRVIPTLQLLAQQECVDLQVLVGLHGFKLKPEYEIEARRLQLKIEFIEISRERTLGEVYNELLDRATGLYCAKIDDDDWYSSTYLCESADLLERVRADIVGKQSHFVYLAKSKKILLRFPGKQHFFTSRVAGGTIFGRAQFFREIGFSNTTIGEDKDFLKRAILANGKIYAGSPLGYVLNRSGENTWVEDESYFLESGIFVRNGEPNREEGV